MRSAGRSVLTLICALAALTRAAASHAQSGEASVDADGPTRTLGGHTFIPSELVRAPFTATSVGSLTGFGYAGVRVSQANQPELNYQLGAAALGFDFQVGLAPWWAVRVAGTGQVLSGVNLASALGIGATVGYEGQVGTTFSFVHRDRVRMGLAIDLSYQPQYRFDIISAITNSVIAGRVDAQTLFNNEQTLALGGAWQAAVTLHRAVGLFGEVRYWHDFTKENDVASSAGRFQGGVGLSVDLHAVTPIPLGFLGTYRASASVRADSQVTHDVSVGAFYTARRHLVLGGEAGITLLPNAPGVRTTIAQGVLILRYYWQ